MKQKLLDLYTNHKKLTFIIIALFALLLIFWKPIGTLLLKDLNFKGDNVGSSYGSGDDSAHGNDSGISNDFEVQCPNWTDVDMINKCEEKTVKDYCGSKWSFNFISIMTGELSVEIDLTKDYYRLIEVEKELMENYSKLMNDIAKLENMTGREAVIMHGPCYADDDDNEKTEEEPLSPDDTKERLLKDFNERLLEIKKDLKRIRVLINNADQPKE